MTCTNCVFWNYRKKECKTFGSTNTKECYDCINYQNGYEEDSPALWLTDD